MTHRIARFGWKPDLPDQRDQAFHADPAVLTALPDHVDLRPQCPPVYDQGELGSCTANAIAGVIHFERLKEHLTDFGPPSRLFIYYEERVREHTVNEDAGAMLRDGLKVVSQLGAPPERDWPYAFQSFALKPPARVYEHALDHRVTRYARVAHAIPAMRACLAQGDPFVLGFTCYESLESPAVSRSGDIPMPEPGEAQIGGHAVAIVGYDAARECWRLRNSWGAAWGHGGYGTLPWAYLPLCADFWTVRLTT